MVFLSTQQVLDLFIGKFEIIHFYEVEQDGETASGVKKHWHFYNIIARKIAV